HHSGKDHLLASRVNEVEFSQQGEGVETAGDTRLVIRRATPNDVPIPDLGCERRTRPAGRVSLCHRIHVADQREPVVTCSVIYEDVWPLRLKCNQTCVQPQFFCFTLDARRKGGFGFTTIYRWDSNQVTQELCKI